MTVDDGHQLGLPAAWARQAGNDRLISDPNAGFSGKDQVRQRADHEVVRVEQVVYEPAAGPELGDGQPGNHNRGQVQRRERLQMLANAGAKDIAELGHRRARMRSSRPWLTETRARPAATR